MMELTKNEIEIIELLRGTSRKKKKNDIILRYNGDGTYKIYELVTSRLDTKYKNVG